MYSTAEINQLIDLVVEETNPDKIILFGSYAYGNPSDKSDLDLLVIKNDKELSHDEHADLSWALYNKRKLRRIRTRYDVFFRTDQQVKKSAENGGAFVDALQRGRVVYVRGNQ
jgi:predicted nucleotidyltransferase